MSKTITDTRTLLDVGSFFGMVLGVGLLIGTYFVPEWRPIAVPAAVIALAGLVWGMR